MNSAESFREQVERLIRMEHDDGDSWDLTANDQAAIKAVLQRMAALDEQVSALSETLKFVLEHSNGISNEAWDRAVALLECLGISVDLKD